jgi:hypothetical protein
LAAVQQSRAALGRRDGRARPRLAQSTAPAFLLVHVQEPHLAYDPPAATRGSFAARAGIPVPLPFTGERYVGGERIADPSREEVAAIEAVYDEEILAADLGIGRLVEGVRAREPRRPAWIFVTADHGEEFWDHGGFEHGHTLFGELLHVPLVVAGAETRPQRIATPVQHADLFRTILGLAGAEPPERSHGEDLIAIARDPGRVAAERELVAEGCLYGSPCAALTSARQRLVFDFYYGRASLYELDAAGQGDRLAEGPAAEAERSRLVERLGQIRGTLEPARVTGEAAQLDAAGLERLRSLGYLR